MPEPWSPSTPAPATGAPPTPGAPPEGEPRRRRPGRWAYALGGLLVLASVLVAAAVLAIGLIRATDVRPLPAAGTAVVSADPGEEIGLYRAAGSVLTRSSPGCRTATVGGVEVPTSPVLGSVTLSRGEATYEAVARVRVPADGRLRVSCAGPGAATGPAPDVFGAVGFAFLVVGAGLAGTGLGALVLLVAFLMRRRGRARP